MGTKITGTSDINQSQQVQKEEVVAQFGCSQVVIVRTQDQKKRLPSVLNNLLCLTVYESKGLEFNDVILYNFFDCGDASTAQWKLLNDIVYTTIKTPKLNDEILDFDLLDNEKFIEFKKKIKDLENQEEDG